MKAKIALVFATLLLSATAAAEMRTHTEAYEIRASFVRLPQSEAGTIAFKRCAECQYETRQMASSMNWKLNGRRTTLAKFRKAMATVSDRDNQLIVVAKRVEDQRVTEVVMWLE